MKNIKNLLFYCVIIGGFSYLIYWIMLLGGKLELGKNIVVPKGVSTHWHQIKETILHNLQHPLALLIAQIVTIIVVARFLGWVFNKIGQPSVIGEIIAGIVLGPSLFGMYFPEASATLFPVQSLENLKMLSQFGLILFMFVIGMELDMKVLRTKAHEAIVISHASIIIPFALGISLSYFLYQSFAPDNVQFLSFALFMGIAMSITAFPVLARIVQERGMHKTKLGAMVITCAAADDITAWCLLAVVIAIVKAGSFVSSLYTVVLAITYVILMLKVVRPFLKRIGELNAGKTSLNKPIVAIFFLALLVSSYLTEVIGIHALFGAFMAGAIMPENSKFRGIFIEKIEDVSLVLLLPLFFVFTGLRTEIGLLNDINLWKITGVIILVAVIGKFVGSALAAKFVGQNWKDSLIIGALMNTRGLMELVVLNIGYDLGVLTPEVFAMMVIMALVTTFMTGPALDLINYLFKKEEKEEVVILKNKSKYKILFSFGTPESGRTLFKLASSLTKKQTSGSVLTAMHLATSNDTILNLEEYEHESFSAVEDEAKHFNQHFTTFFKVSNDIETDIAETANKGEYDLLLIGLGESIYEGTLLGKLLGFTTRIVSPEKLINTVTRKERLFDFSIFDEKTHNILQKTTIPTGILLDKNLNTFDHIFALYFDNEDDKLVHYINKFIINNESQVSIVDFNKNLQHNLNVKEKIRSIEQNAPNHIAVRSEEVLTDTFLSAQDLMLVSIDSWKKLVESKVDWLSRIPSVLIIK